MSAQSSDHHAWPHTSAGWKPRVVTAARSAWTQLRPSRRARCSWAASTCMVRASRMIGSPWARANSGSIGKRVRRPSSQTVPVASSWSWWRSDHDRRSVDLARASCHRRDLSAPQPPCGPPYAPLRPMGLLGGHDAPGGTVRSLRARSAGATADPRRWGPAPRTLDERSLGEMSGERSSPNCGDLLGQLSRQGWTAGRTGLLAHPF